MLKNGKLRKKNNWNPLYFLTDYVFTERKISKTEKGNISVQPVLVVRKLDNKIKYRVNVF